VINYSRPQQLQN